MTSEIRKHLLGLPFVSVSAEGGLDFWAFPYRQPDPIGAHPHRHRADGNAGRSCCGRLLHTMREFQAPHLLFYVLEEWTGTLDHAQRGFLAELTDALVAAPFAESCSFQIAAAYHVGELQARLGPIAETGDYSEDQARGRYMAGKFCVSLRRDESKAATLAQEMFEAYVGWPEAARIGFAQIVAEVASSCARDATLYQEATWPLHRDQSVTLRV